MEHSNSFLEYRVIAGSGDRNLGKFDLFLNELSAGFSVLGFSVNRGVRLDPYLLEIVAVTSAYEASKFGKMTRIVPVTSIDNVTTPDLVKDFSSRAMKYCLDNRDSLLPRGFGGSLLSVPTIVSEGFPEEIKKWIGGNRSPRHWAAFEFPVLVSTVDRQIYYYKKTPLWGAAYYGGFRKFVEEVLGVTVRIQKK